MVLRRKLPAALFALLAAGLISSSVGDVATVRSAAAAEETEPPVTITADRMEYYSDRNIVIFTGNALAVRGDVTLSAARMEVTLTQGADSEENSVSRIIAEGEVNFRHVDPETGIERFATGERGEYLADEEQVILTGSPRVWEGKNVVTGERMTFHIDEDRFVVEGDKDRPVGLTIYQEKKGEE